jgi:hypothetical protein
MEAKYSSEMLAFAYIMYSEMQREKFCTTETMKIKLNANSDHWVAGWLATRRGKVEMTVLAYKANAAFAATLLQRNYFLEENICLNVCNNTR